MIFYQQKFFLSSILLDVFPSEQSIFHLFGDCLGKCAYTDERLRNQRPTLVVPPDVSTSVKEIWIGNVLLLETFLLKFLPAPKGFGRREKL